MTVVAYNLAPVRGPDATFFRAMQDALGHRKIDLILYTPQKNDEMSGFCRPFSWEIRRIQEQYNLSRPNWLEVDAEAEEKWVARIGALSLQADELDPRDAFQVLLHHAEMVIEQDRPRAVLCWNTLCPHSGIMADVAPRFGITPYLIERAFLPDTWYFEKGGLVGHSELASMSAEELYSGATEVERRAWQAVGHAKLLTRPFDRMNRYAQVDNPEWANLVSSSRQAGRPIISFFPPDDLSLGFIPADHEDRRKHLQFKDSFAAAEHLAKRNPDVEVAFKPHPSFRQLSLESDVPNLHIVNHDYRRVIADSDVVASTGSGLALVAMADGKPVLTMGCDWFSDKGAFYEALDGSPEAVRRALEAADLEERREALHTFVGWSLCNYLISLPDLDPGLNGVEQLADEIARADQPRRRGGTLPRLSPKRGAEDLFKQLEEAVSGEDSETCFLVDLDHTLVFDNTTESYLASVRPSFLFTAIHWLVSWWVPWKTLAKRGYRRDELFDPLRILFATLLVPATAFIWRRKVRNQVRKRANHPLLEKLRQLPSERVAIITNGHPFVIKPLLRAAGIGSGKVICGNVLPGKNDIRHTGKMQAALERAPEFFDRPLAVITDSMADEDLLRAADAPYLIDWSDVKNKAKPNRHYFPFVLTAAGKYAGAGVVSRHRFKEDLPILAIAFALQPIVALWGGGAGAGLFDLILAPLLILASLFAYFVSFNAVYEIGYWENDFVAARREQKPSVNKKMAAFEDYPVRTSAWWWGMGCGAIGSVCAAATGQSVLTGLIGSTLSGLPRFATEALLLTAVWLLALLVVRGVFKLHNSIDPKLRVFSFWTLHFSKLAVYAVVWPVALVGAALLFAQTFRHWPNYIVYRHGGRTKDTPKAETRLFFFLAISFVLGVAGVFVLNSWVWWVGVLFCLNTLPKKPTPRRVRRIFKAMV